jgi:predicted Zn-dependent protease
MTIDQVLTGYLDECQRRGIQGEVRAVQERREELVARNGSVESEGVTDDAIVSLTVSDGVQWAVLASGVDVAARTVVADGLALLRSTSGKAAGRLALTKVRPGRREWPGRSAARLAGVREQLISASVLPGARECELRATQVGRTIRYATRETFQVSPSSHASIVLRATRSGANGEIVHVDRTDSGPDLGWLLDRFDAGMLDDSRRQLLAPALRTSSVLPSRVVLDRTVAAQLVYLLGEALSGESVAQGRSQLAGQLGCQVASKLVTVIDDPTRAGAPRHSPFDDEGSAAEPRSLIDEGQLRGFLGSRAYAADGAMPGNARQPDMTSAARPAASNLFVVPAQSPVPLDTPTLRITQTHGMHLSNAITGEFATGATGLVHDGEDVWHVTGLSVAGNVLDLFQNLEELGCELSWADDAESSFGAPDLVAAGLTIGR